MEEDQEQRKTGSMDESSAMTIEFLRARLLSERSVSKSARQRVEDLAKRVAELEEQLKFVSLQRKKAEKATMDVLAILENRGIKDVPEEFDSSSEKDDFKVDDGSTNTKPGDDEEEDAYSSSEIESSTSTGRSLSWKSTKHSQHSFETKTFMESVRRRATSVSTSSSARRVGKSCRKMRRRETRSMEESQNGDTERAACALDGSNDGTGHDNEQGREESTALALHSENRETDEQYFDGHGRDVDMESALQRQAQFIGRYEEEEKAQREWEEKFNNGAQESGDAGNHSDVTEERYEMETPELSRSAEKSNPDNEKMKQEPDDARCSNDPRTCKSSPHLTNIGKGSLKDEPSASEFSFPTSKERSMEELPRKPPYPSPHNAPSLELAVLPQESSNNLGSILQALQQAKLSLNQNLHPVAAEASGNMLEPSKTGTRKMDTFNVPFVSPALFRLPTDTQFEVTTIATPGNGLQPGRLSFTPEIASSIFPCKPPGEPSTAFYGSLFHTAPYGSFGPEIRSVAPPQRSFSQPRLSEGSLSPYTSHTRSLVEDTYPYLPDFRLSLPSNEGGPSRTFPSSGSGLPPAMCVSSYYDQFRPNR